jgi:phage tail tape-measure protein
VLSGITATGSALGATNIPVVNQIGSAVGTIADITNNFFGTQN